MATQFLWMRYVFRRAWAGKSISTNEIPTKRNNINPLIVSQKSAKILRNTLKSLVVLLLVPLAFVCFITLFPLIGSLSMHNFPIMHVVKDNFSLIPPLCLVGILLSPVFGWASTRFKRKRFLYLLMFGAAACQLAILLVMFLWAPFRWEDTGTIFLVWLWAFVAYSFMSLPILAPAILLIERWTRDSA